MPGKLKALATSGSDLCKFEYAIGGCMKKKIQDMDGKAAPLNLEGSGPKPVPKCKTDPLDIQNMTGDIGPCCENGVAKVQKNQKAAENLPEQGFDATYGDDMVIRIAKEKRMALVCLPAAEAEAAFAGWACDALVEKSDDFFKTKKLACCGSPDGLGGYALFVGLPLLLVVGLGAVGFIMTQGGGDEEGEGEEAAQDPEAEKKPEGAEG